MQRLGVGEVRHGVGTWAPDTALQSTDMQERKCGCGCGWSVVFLKRSECACDEVCQHLDGLLVQTPLNQYTQSHTYMSIVGMEIKAVRWGKEMCHCTLVCVRHNMFAKARVSNRRTSAMITQCFWHDR